MSQGVFENESVEIGDLLQKYVEICLTMSLSSGQIV